MRGHFAHLKEDSEWYPFFPNGFVPTRNAILEVNVSLEELGPTDCHLVEVSRLTEDQKVGIAERIASKKGVLPAEVLHWMIETGVIPLRADQVSGTSTDMRWFI